MSLASSEKDVGLLIPDTHCQVFSGNSNSTLQPMSSARPQVSFLSLHAAPLGQSIRDGSGWLRPGPLLPRLLLHLLWASFAWELLKGPGSAKVWDGPWLAPPQLHN